MSRLVVSLPDGFHLHGFLSTGLAAAIVDGTPDGVEFLIPPGADACIPAALHGRATWSHFPALRPSAVDRALHFVRMEASHRLRAGSDWELVRRKHTGKRGVKRVARTLGAVLARAPRLDALLARIERRGPVAALGNRLALAAGDTLVVGSAGIKQLDASLLAATRPSRARRYGIVYSWDNISAKWSAFQRFERVAVWNDVMRREAVEQLGYRDDQVAVVGPPQFDVYAGFRPSRPRPKFLAALGLPEDARYLLYAGVPAATAPGGPDYVATLAEARPDAFILVRTHPQDHPDTYAGVREHPRVVIVDASREAGADLRRLGFWLPRADQAQVLAEQIHHADVVVNVASTVTLEALRLGRPVVNIGYDPPGATPPVRTAEYYGMRHYAEVVRSGAVPVAGSPAELREQLEGVGTWWPEREKEREQLNRLIDPFQDGGATRRLAEDVLRFHGAQGTS